MVLIALPALAAAQSVTPLPRVTPSLPPIGLPLPRITPALPTIGLPPLVDPRVAAASRPSGSRAGHARSGRGRGRSGPAAILVVPAFAWDYDGRSTSATRTPSSRQGAPRPGPMAQTTGTLRLDVHPAALVQVYIDDVFVGTPSDFAGDLELEAGTHRVELRAQGYQTPVFDVLITPGRPVTFRRTLELAGRPAEPAVPPAGDAPAPPPAAPAAPIARSTIYAIPGCYLGNVPPKDAGLPPSCDQSRVVTFEP
jgi:hypothetical protein